MNEELCMHRPSGTDLSEYDIALEACFQDQQRMVEIKGGIANRGHFIMHFLRPGAESSQDTVCRTQTSTQLLHKFVAAPGMTSVRLTMALRTSSFVNNRTKLKEVAQGWFSFLMNNNGYVTFEMEMAAKSHMQHQNHLKVVHWDSQWTIDGASCKGAHAPPSLDFDDMPSNVCGIQAWLYSTDSVLPQGNSLKPL